jgi:hypothetical protein
MTFVQSHVLMQTLVDHKPWSTVALLNQQMNLGYTKRHANGLPKSRGLTIQLSLQTDMHVPQNTGHTPEQAASQRQASAALPGASSLLPTLLNANQSLLKPAIMAAPNYEHTPWLRSLSFDTNKLVAEKPLMQGLPTKCSASLSARVLLFFHKLKTHTARLDTTAVPQSSAIGSSRQRSRLSF